MQQDAGIYLLLNYSNCFGRPSCPSSGVHKTVVAASGTDHTIWGASYFKRDQIRTGCDVCEQAVSKPVWHIPIAVFTVTNSWWWAEDLSETCRVLFQK